MTAEWYYTQSGQRQGPVNLEQLTAYVRAGAVRAGDLAWHGGMTDWKPVSEIPELASDQAPSAVPVQQAGTLPYSTRQLEELPFTPRAMQLLIQTRPWVRFIAVLMFIASGMMLLFPLAILGMAAVGGGGPTFGPPVVMMIVYIPVALLYIVPAVYLNRYASRITQLQQLNRADLLEGALEAQKSFWKYVGIMFLIVLVIYVLVIVAGGLLVALR